MTAQNRKELLARAREIALKIAHTKGIVTSDDVAAKLGEKLGPAAGSVFKTPDFVFTGERVNSTQPNNHQRELKVWKLTTVGEESARKIREKKNEAIAAAYSPVEETQSQRTPALPTWLK